MSRIWAVAERDLRKFARTPMLMLSSVGFPLIHLLIMGASLEGELKRIPVIVVNHDPTGAFARRVQQNLLAVVAGNETFSLEYDDDENRAYRRLKEGRCRALLIIPADFSRDMVRGESADIGLVLDNTDAVTSEALHAAIAAAVADLSPRVTVKPTEPPGPALRVVQHYRKVEYIQYLVPGVIVMAAFMGTMISGATSLVMDRFQGVHESYFLSPLSRTDIVLGMLTSGMITTSVSTILVTIGSCALTGLWPPNWQSGLMACVVMIVTSVGLLGLMFLAYSSVRNPRAVGVVGGFLNMILYFPSGALYPVESFPPWLRAFSRFDPETYAVNAMKALLLRETPPNAVMEDLLILVAFAVGAATLAILTFRRRL